MRISLFGERIHFTSFHAKKLLLLAIICFVVLSLVFPILSYFQPKKLHYNYGQHYYDYTDKHEASDLLQIIESDNNRVVKEDLLDMSNELQQQIDYIGSYLKVFIRPVANQMGRFYYDAVLINAGNKTITGQGWSIYLYSTKMLDCDRIKLIKAESSTQKWLRDSTILDNEVTVSHVTGYTFKMEPAPSFNFFLPDGKMVVRFVGSGWFVSRSEFIPKWYVAGHKPDVIPRIISSTDDENLKFVGDFLSKSSKVRFENDGFKPLSPSQRFKMNVIKRKKPLRLSLVPTPFLIKIYESYKVVINKDWTIYYMEDLENEAVYLKDKLNLKTSLKQMTSDLMSEDNKEILHNVIFLRLFDTRSLMNVTSLFTKKHNSTKSSYYMKNLYKMEVRLQKVQIWGCNPSGVFYGVITLVNILKSLDSGSDNLEALPCGIVDAPRFEHRGLMIDVSRNFFSVESIMKVVDVMAVYKMNVLHLHLSDDEGWRLEIPGLPELTKVGGARSHDPSEQETLMSFLGSDPNPSRVSKLGSGFYSVEQFRNLLRYANKRHVTVIPEFDMPSHSHAAIVSMKARHRDLIMNKANNSKNDYLLSDLHDTSLYSTGQFYSSSAINPCLKSTYRFVHHILHHLVLIYKDVAPLKYFHLGGDEVPKDAYSGSPACMRLLKSGPKKNEKNDFFARNPTVPLNLKSYFIENVAWIATRLNLSLIGWDDAFLKDDGSLMSFQNNNNDVEGHGGGIPLHNIVAQYYYNIWEQGLASKPYTMANRGMKVILSPITSLYFDSPQEPDPEDWGLHWASRYTDTRRTFFFAPSNLYNSIDYTFDGQPINKKKVCMQYSCDLLKKPENILGIEAALWSELVRTPERMHSMLFPRLLAVAERGWHEALWEREVNDSLRLLQRRKSWEYFAMTVGLQELKRLENLNISYYLPRPGALITDSGLSVNCMFPGMRIQVSEDYGLTWIDRNQMKNYTNSNSLLVSTVSFDGKRRSTPVAIKITTDDIQ